MYYDYLRYRVTRLCRRTHRLDQKIDALEVKYMHKEVPVWDWKQVEQDSKKLSDLYISGIDPYDNDVNGITLGVFKKQVEISNNEDRKQA